MEVAGVFRVRFALPLLLLAASIWASVPALAATHASHALAVQGHGFWRPQRVDEALANGAPGEADRPPARQPTPAGATATASSLKVIDASSIEDRTNGRIFGVDPNEGPYSCSGTSLATPSGSIVLTAGHCVLENGSWGTHLVFVPAFDHQNRPFGTFVATDVFVTRQWARSENSDFDVAALQVEPNALGTLTAAVGARSYTTGRSRFARQQIFGYPAAALNGEELRSCLARGQGEDWSTAGSLGPPPMPAHCDMASGSSGGAWLFEGSLIDGVTSYSYVGNPYRLYSPYFGPAIGDFLAGLP